jgi:hypothetical protein
MRRSVGENLMWGYFLGRLSQEERTRVEDRYLADPEVFEQFVAAENDLIDAYIRGDLTESEKQRFEARYSQSPQRERVDFAHALVQICASEKDAAPKGRNPLLKKMWAILSIQHHRPEWVLAATLVVITMSGGWLLVQNERLRAGLQHAAERQDALLRENDTLRQQIALLQDLHEAQVHQQGSEVARLETPMNPEVTFYLTPGIARGLESTRNSRTLPTKASHLRLELLLDRDEYKTYGIALLDSDGKELSSVNALRSHLVGGRVVVTWRLPVSSLDPGDYIVQLKGQRPSGSPENVAFYSFRLLRR